MPFTSCLIWLISIMPSSPVIDGQFNDWQPSSNRDDWSIQSHADANSISLFLQQPGPPSVFQQLDEPLMIGLDLDEDIDTGCRIDDLGGCDLVFELSPAAKGRRRGGVTAASWNSNGFRLKETPYKYGFVLAPSTASRRHEIRIDRANLPHGQRQLRVVIRPESNKTFEHMITLPDAGSPRVPGASVPTKRIDSIRVVSWNIEYGGMLKRPDQVRSILHSLRPDILLLQEIENTQSIDELKQFLQSIHDGDEWTLSVNRNTGNLRSAVATRLPAAHVAEFKHVTRSDDADRSIRAAALLIDLGADQKTLAVSIHLKCCGGLNGPEDLARISETLSIREAIETAARTHRPDGLLIGGDFNLVASPLPLDILRLDGQRLLGPHASGPLQDASPLHLDGRDAYTWYDSDSSFTPGKLDYVLIGGDLKQTASFILDTSDLDPDQAGDLEPGITQEASDHLPIVVDVTVAPE